MLELPRVIRTGTVSAEEQLESLLALKPACARSSLLAHRTGENPALANETEDAEALQIRS